MAQKANVTLVDAGGIVNPVTGGVGQAVDGQTVVAGDVVLLIHPPNGDAYAGPWVAAVGAWTRATDWDGPADITLGDEWYVEDGVEYTGTKWHFDDDAVPTSLNTDLLTISQLTRRRALDTGSGISISGTTPPVISWTAPSDVESTFYEGLRLVYLSATSIRIEAGAAYIPASGVANAETDTDLTGLTLTASTMYYLYAYDAGGGVLAFDAPSTQAPTTTPYRGGARTKGPDGSPDLTRRYVGQLFASATNTVAKFIHRLPGTIIYDVATGASPYRVADNSLTGASYLARSCSPVVPPTSRRAIARMNNTAGATIVQIGDTAGAVDRYTVSANTFWIDDNLILNSSQQFYFRYSAGAPATGLTVDILGYHFEA